MAVAASIRAAAAQLDALPAPGDPFLRNDVLEQQGRLACRAGDADGGRALLQRALTGRQQVEDAGSPRVAVTARALAACGGR